MINSNAENIAVSHFAAFLLQTNKSLIIIFQSVRHTLVDKITNGFLSYHHRLASYSQCAKMTISMFLTTYSSFLFCLFINRENDNQSNLDRGKQVMPFQDGGSRSIEYSFY